MIATHDHPDHSGGLPYIIKNFPVGEFWSVADISPEIQKALKNRAVAKRTLAAGEKITLPGPVVISVLSPPQAALGTAADTESSVNEQSLVFHLRYGGFTMIFCADAGFIAEQQILAGNYEVKSTVLKVGHHGSRFSTSAAFLDRVQPEVALISAGKDNRFGLPSRQTVTLLNSKDIRQLRTDRDGTIELISDGISWSASTPFKPD